MLSEASPYFASLIKSGFSESSPKTDDSTPSSGAVETSFESTVEEDSDREEAPEEAKQSPNFPHYRVVIVHASYRTYYAVLGWILTGRIRFANLSSSRVVADSEVASSHAKITFPPSEPGVPPPSSPKSVCRLAHYLQLAILQQMALNDFAKQLTPVNAADELLSEACNKHEELRNLVIRVIVGAQKEFKESKGWLAAMERADEFAWPGARATLALSDALLD